MKKPLIMLFTTILLIGCGTKELSKDDALKLLRKEKNYPRVVERSIFCRDAGHARMVLNAGLENNGFVKVQKTVKMFQQGRVPIIFFTDKAKPYLLPYASKEDEKDYIRPVRLAEEDVVEIVSISSNPQEKATLVKYRTEYINVTPFIILSKKGSINQQLKSASFILDDNGNWILKN